VNGLNPFLRGEDIMLLPLDWDKPSEGNEELCSKFSYGLYKTDGHEMPYRLFIPKISKPVPLVLYLHGADAVGHDNESQLRMHDIGTVLVRDGWQKRHPCIVLAPQYNADEYWNEPWIYEGIYKLIKKYTDTGAADKERIYVYGYSAGGVGTYHMLNTYPEIFASAVPICGVTGRRTLAVIEEKPVWMVHAADDRIVKASYKKSEYRELSNFGSHDIYEELKDRAKELKYTEYAKGEMKKLYGVNPHCSWVALSDEKNIGIWEWLFSKRMVL